jgi:predicted O-linked N-acetylglucosamine transferase (SPINDLY family)
MRVADVFLDSVGWSGCNTTLEAFAAGLPAVTCRGETMRARHTAAMLEMIGLADCIAETVDAYVTLAARMGRDTAWRSEIANKLNARRDVSA